MVDMPQRPIIEYPCEWEYRIIGLDPMEIRRAVVDVVVDVVADTEYSLTEANHKGKYLSMSLLLQVEDQAQRDRIFRALKQSPHVRMVL